MQWLGKLWNEFYQILNQHSAEKYEDPFNDYTEEPDTEQDNEKEKTEKQVHFKIPEQE